MIAFDHGPAQTMDAVIAAAIFGFVYIHPFEDGNGRLHRYLIHHVLAERGYNPPGVVFPVSAAILDQIDRYRATLESYSQRLLPHLRWEPTENFNVRVMNDTADLYRFFDATPHAEFLYECVKRTIEHDLPYEADFLRRYDEFCRRIEGMVDMLIALSTYYSGFSTRMAESFRTEPAQTNSMRSLRRKWSGSKRYMAISSHLRARLEKVEQLARP